MEERVIINKRFDKKENLKEVKSIIIDYDNTYISNRLSIYTLENLYDIVNQIEALPLEKIIKVTKSYIRITNALKMIDNYTNILRLTKSRKLINEAQESIFYLVEYELLEPLEFYYEEQTKVIN